MPEVEFKEYQSQPTTNFDTSPKIIRWVIDYSGGLVKDKKQATYVLLGFVAIVVVFSLFLVFNSKQTTIEDENINKEYEEYMLYQSR